MSALPRSNVPPATVRTPRAVIEDRMVGFPNLVGARMVRRVLGSLVTSLLCALAVGASGFDVRDVGSMASIAAALGIIGCAFRVGVLDVVFGRLREYSAAPTLLVAATFTVPGASIAIASLIVHGTRWVLGRAQRHDDRIEFGACHVIGLTAFGAASAGAMPGVVGTVSAAMGLVALTVGRAESRHLQDVIGSARIAVTLLLPVPAALIIAPLVALPLPVVALAVLVPCHVLVRRMVRRAQLRQSLAIELADIVDARIPWRAQHVSTVCDLARDVAAELDLSIVEQRRSWWIARLMDVGLVGTPEGPMSSARRLDPREQIAVQYHSVRTSELISLIGFGPHVVDGVLYHHERWDGTGPLAREGDAMTPPTRIASACDAWCAMVATRPHRAAMEPRDALELLRADAGAHHDPDVIRAMERLLPQIARGWDDPVSAPVPESDPDVGSDARRLQAVAYDPAVQDAAYRQHIIARCRAIVRADQIPVLFVRPGVRVADLSWLSEPGAEIWAAPTTTVINCVDSIGVYRYELGSEDLRVLDPDGATRARGTHPPTRAFEWRLFSSSSIVNWVVTPLIIVALVAVAWFTAFVTATVPSESMRPTLSCQDRIIIRSLGESSSLPHRGDVVVFDLAKMAGAAPGQPKDWLVKRVVARGAHEVRLLDGVLRVDGVPVSLPPSDQFPADRRWVMRANDVFVIGDNSLASIDGRLYGPVGRSAIVGTVIGRLWPPSLIHADPGVQRPSTKLTC